MKKVTSLILALLMCLSLCACGNKKEDERIFAMVSDAMSQLGITEYKVEDKVIIVPEFKSLSNSEKLALVKYVRKLEGVSSRVSDGHASYYYEPYSIAQNAPQPGVYEGGKLIYADKNPFQ